MNHTNHSTITHKTFVENQDYFTPNYQQLALTHEIQLSAQGKLLPYSHIEPNQSAQLNTEAQSEPSVSRQKSRARNTSEIDRVKIKTAARAGLSPREIVHRFGFTIGQVYYALRNSTKPRTCENGGKPAIPQDKAKELVSWIRRGPYNRRVPFQLIPEMAPELELQGYGKRAIRTAVESQGFGRGVSKRKGLSVADLID